MKFTQPSKATDESSSDEEDEVDSLDVDKKLSLSETPKPTPTVRLGMSNVRQHPLTAGLLRQLSDFTSDIYYHIYYTSPSTGEEKKQPLTFRSNTDGIKSFLPIRNAAIRARDDKACGLLCAILLEGCVDDYAGGEVTEEMVANQMKKDFEWTDEQLGEFCVSFRCLADIRLDPLSLLSHRRASAARIRSRSTRRRSRSSRSGSEGRSEWDKGGETENLRERGLRRSRTLSK